MLNKKHDAILKAIFAKPIQSNIAWKDIESLLEALGAELSEGNSSRVRIALNDRKAVSYRPHPQKETDKGAVVSMRRFLIAVGINVY